MTKRITHQIVHNGSIVAFVVETDAGIGAVSPVRGVLPRLDSGVRAFLSATFEGVLGARTTPGLVADTLQVLLAPTCSVHEYVCEERTRRENDSEQG